MNEPQRWKTTLTAFLGVLACVGCAHEATAPNPDAWPQDDPGIAVVMFDTCSKPPYPPLDLRANHEGTVNFEFLVNEEGRAIDSRIIQSTGHPGLDEAARGALMKCRFKPALHEGRPVAKWTEIAYTWIIG